MKITVDTMFTNVDYEGDTLLQEKVRDKMHVKMGVKDEKSFHSRAYKNGYWDGITDFYDMKEDKFHTGLLPQFLEGIGELQEKGASITYDLEDIRSRPLVDPESIDSEIVLGDGDKPPITLRDYQYDSVESIFKQQVGIVNISTGGGKTEVASGFTQQVIPYLKRGERVAFFVHSTDLFYQSAKRFQTRLNLRPDQIGYIGDSKFDVKNKNIVFVMVPTLSSALKDPKKGVNFTDKERVIKFIAEEVAPKFQRGGNTRKLLRNYIKNCTLKTKVWQSAEEHLQYIAYDKKFTDRTAKMQLQKYIVEFDKIVQKKNKKKFDKYKQVMDFIESIRVLIVDECHRAKADTWFNTISLCKNATYRIGLTGTVDKKDKVGWQRLQALFRGVLDKVSNEFLIKRGVSSTPIIRLVPIANPKGIELVNNYLEAYKKGIVENDYRNYAIVKLVEAYKKKKPGGVLISVKEIDHGERVLALLREKGMDAEFIHGGSDKNHRSLQLQRFSQGELEILVSSTILDEGVDMKNIGCLVLGAGGKSMRQQLQRIGRGLRLNGIDGNRVLVFDFLDLTNKFLKNHSKERISLFKAEKFDVQILGQQNKK